MKTPPKETGTLPEGKPHPMAFDAMDWLKEYQITKFGDWCRAQEAIASSALSSNEAAEVLHSTIRRLNDGKPVSDRYLLGLCWFLRYQLGT